MNARSIATTYEFTYLVLGRNTEGITNEMSLSAPAPGVNCLNWVVGHILATRSAILKLVGEEPIWSAAQAAPYQRGSEPLAPGRISEARPFDSLLADLARSQDRLQAGLAGITPERLEAPGLEQVPGGVQPVGAQLAIFNFHEAYHAGQTGILRRLLGLPGALR